MDVKELGILLRKNMTTDNISHSLFSEFVPKKRKKIRGENNVKECDMWIFSENEPDKDILKSMFAEFMYITTKTLMNNHIYEFSNELHVQTDEGSIGVEFTGVASEIYMLKWCYKLKN